MIPDSTRIMAIVKADAYGHGAPWVARAALGAGATLLGVATVSEGRTLRACGISAPIVLLGSIDPIEVETACRLGLEITIADAGLLEAVQRSARRIALPGPVAVHVKIDTGLRRYGAMPDDALPLAATIAADTRLTFSGIFTHFASADEPEEAFTREQLALFERTVESMRELGIELPPLHAANSAGILTGTGVHLDIVRLGISLYGVPPSREVALPEGMRPALRMESRIARIIPIEPGDTVGYNRTYQADAPTAGALVPIGYADGYRRALSGRGWMGIHGVRAKVLGRVSMDQTVVEVQRGVRAQAGDSVHIMGEESSTGAPTVADVADLLGTNTYEILVGIRQRIPRVFVQGGETIAVRDAADASTYMSDGNAMLPLS
jgi:alanine racemase